jgi:3-oxoacyl-[acyl-carrier protein] reductase
MIRPGEQLENPVTGEVLIFHETAAQTGGELVRVETIVRPDGFVAAAHVHPAQTERFDVLAGTVDFTVGRETVRAHEGDRIVVPPGTPHRFRNAGPGWSGKSSAIGLNETKTKRPTCAFSAASTSARFPAQSTVSIASVRGKQVAVETTQVASASGTASLSGSVRSAVSSDAPSAASSRATAEDGSRTSARTSAPRASRARQIFEPSAPVAPATAMCAVGTVAHPTDAPTRGMSPTPAARSSDDHAVPGRLEGRYALVTGAGTGLGATIAEALAGEGAHVAVHYRSSAAGADETAQRIRALGREALPVQGDIGDWDDVQRMAREVVDGFGRIDVLVNNVGEMAASQLSWRELTPEAIDRTLAVDVKGTMLMTHEFGRRMLDDQQAGSIVNIGSRVVVEGSPRAPQYAAGKYAIIGITKSYAHALAPHVRVNTLGPGFVETPALLAREDWRSGRREAVLARTPLARIPKPEDVVPPVIFLACDDSRHMTGAFLLCDGGHSMVGA